jgi:hypothetical protein
MIQVEVEVEQFFVVVIDIEICDKYTPRAEGGPKSLACHTCKRTVPWVRSKLIKYIIGKLKTLILHTSCYRQGPSAGPLQTDKYLRLHVNSKAHFLRWLDHEAGPKPNSSGLGGMIAGIFF